MTLRQSIQKILTQNENVNNNESAAIQICLFLEDKIGLLGNGWFDDDKDLLKILCTDDDDDDEN